MSRLKELLAAKKLAAAALVKDEAVIAQVSASIPEPKVVASNFTPTLDHPNPEVNKIRMQLAELDQALLSAIPAFATILQDIHNKLGADPAVVTLMSEAEIEIIVRGMTKHADLEIVKPKTVRESKRAVSKVQIGADDL